MLDFKDLKELNTSLKQGWQSYWFKKNKILLQTETIKTWLKNNNMYIKHLDQYGNPKELLYAMGLLRYLITGVKLEQHRLQQQEDQRTLDSKYKHIFDKISLVAQQGIPADTKDGIKRHYIYESRGKILILANLSTYQQLFLYDPANDKVTVGQCIKRYHIKPSRLGFDGSYIRYGMFRKHGGYEYNECKSLAPNFTAIPGTFKTYNTNYNAHAISGLKFTDMYQYDLDHLQFQCHKPVIPMIKRVRSNSV